MLARLRTTNKIFLRHNCLHRISKSLFFNRNVDFCRLVQHATKDDVRRGVQNTSAKVLILSVSNTSL